MPPGEAFTDAQRQEIDRGVAEAERISGWSYAVHVGASDVDTRGFAEGLHAGLPDPPRSVLVQVDPQRRALEIVTGTDVMRALDNRSAALVAVTMQSAFATGDLSRGIIHGLQQLSQLARPARTLHTDTP